MSRIWGFCAFVFVTANPALNVWGGEPSTAELQEQIKSLQAQVNELKAQRAAPVLNKADVDATVQAVLSDAGRQSRLMDMEKFSSGYKSDKGFVLQSDDGQFLLHPWILFQFRNETTYRSSAKGGDSDLQNGFETRRLKLGLDGNVFGPDFTYQFIWSVDRHTGIFSWRMRGRGITFRRRRFIFGPGRFAIPSITNRLFSGLSC